jgi:hypothetical protein
MNLFILDDMYRNQAVAVGVLGPLGARHGVVRAQLGSRSRLSRGRFDAHVGRCVLCQGQLPNTFQEACSADAGGG